MADAKRVAASDNSGLSGVASILDLLGGQKSTTTTSSPTGQLTGILNGLQSQGNYEDVVKSLFTQAGGQIPGLVAAKSNALGARTGDNSAVNNDLSKLMESTVMKAAGQTAELQQRNTAQQIQAAQAIANGNKTTNTNSGTNLGKAGQNLAILQLGSKLLGSDTGKSLVAKGKSLFDTSPASTPGAELNSAGDINGSFGFSNSGSDQFSFGDNGGASSNLFFNGAGSDAALGDFGDAFSGGSGDAGLSSDIGNGFGDAAIDDSAGGAFDGLGDFFDFADGGLIGRDGKKSIDYPMGGKTMGPSAQAGSPQAYADGGRIEPKVGTRSPLPSGGTGGGLSKSATSAATSASAPAAGDKNKSGVGALRANPATQPELILHMRMQDAGEGYADGGRIEPKIGSKSPLPSGGTGGGLSKPNVAQSSNDPKGASKAPEIHLHFEPGSIPRYEKAIDDSVNGTPKYADGGSVRSGGGRASSRPTFDVLNPESNSAVQAPREGLNNVRGRDLELGNLDLGDNGGTATSSPGNTAPNAPTAQSAAVGNAIGNAVGNMTMSAVIGPVAMAIASLTGHTPQSALSQAIAAIGNATGSGPAGASPNGSVATGPATATDAATGQSVATEGGLATGTTSVNTDTGDGDDGGIGASGDGSSDGGVGTSAGNAGDANGGDGSPDGGGAGGDGFSSGGKITGPGTGTSDSINIRASAGEYMMPADVVQTLGVNFFDELKNHFHVPADIQNGR